MTALLVSIACLALNAFFVAAEFAIVKVRATQLRGRVRRGERRAVAAAAVLAKLDRFLTVTQFGITVASLGLGWIGEPALAHLGDVVAIALTGAELGRVGHIVVDVVGLGTLTFLHLLLGELVPKAIAIRHSEATALATALPLSFVNATFSPLLWLLERMQRFILRLLRVDPDAPEVAFTEDEVVAILASNAARGAAAGDKQKVLERVLRFAARPVRQSMVPRVDVVALPIDSPAQEAYEVLRHHEFSRILLFDTSIDDIAGYLYAKDLLLDDRARERATVRGLERRALFTPETSDGLSVLREMQRTGIPFAVVVDEYGGTSGIVTMEDLVEEVFGDIRDELDDEPAKIVRIDGDPPAWDVEAQVTADELRDAGMPVLEPGREPIGKLLLERLGHFPEVGETATLSDRLVAEVTATRRRRIQRVRVRLAPA